MKKIFALMLFGLVACQTKDQYDPSSLYDRVQQDRIIAGIIAHIYTPPPYVLMSDRLKPEHRDYYLTQTFRFNLLKLHVADDSTHYFLIERPAPGANHRVVGGQFKLLGEELKNFKEIFVTPDLPSKELTERSEFLFDKMVKGEIEQFLNMKSYVQWPNTATYYDTITFEWKLKPGYSSTDSTGVN